MISQAFFSSFLAHPRLVFRGAIASLSLLLLVASNPFPVYSQEQAGSSQPSTPSIPGNVSGSRSILKQGSRGDAVSDLQALLKLLGFYTGAIDGVYQDSTTSAVAAFQQAAGLQADGVVGAETWMRLLPPSPVVNGANNNGANSTATSTPSSVRAVGAASANGAIANSAAPASSRTFPSPTASPAANGSAFPSPTAQSPSPSVTAPPTAPAASQSSPRTSASQASTPQASAPQASTPTTVSAPVDLPILRVGMRGSAIDALQERLKSIGAFKGAIDGVFGAETQEAVKTAQRSFNLEPDGVVGPATWTALLR